MSGSSFCSGIAVRPVDFSERTELMIEGCALTSWTPPRGRPTSRETKLLAAAKHSGISHFGVHFFGAAGRRSPPTSYRAWYVSGNSMRMNSPASMLPPASLSMRRKRSMIRSSPRPMRRWFIIRRKSRRWSSPSPSVSNSSKSSGMSSTLWPHWRRFSRIRWVRRMRSRRCQVSVKALPMIPMGMAMYSTPVIVHSATTTWPPFDDGLMSPYPTVVIVMIVKYIAVGSEATLERGSTQ
mmetsp:Transcript_115360/g.326881  ORF Transcript_115360/g.326881 Transcript_115360/m.326881 type:complete len:238 (+) Transcript_115360:356-1069(+)